MQTRRTLGLATADTSFIPTRQLEQMHVAAFRITLTSSTIRDRTSSVDSQATDEDTQRLARTKNPACAALS